MKENVIEWFNGDEQIGCTFSQVRFINKVKKLAEKYPDKVSYIENEDGSIYAHLPLKALKLNIIISNAPGGFKKANENPDD